jgi:hypothetical protein
MRILLSESQIHSVIQKSINDTITNMKKDCETEDENIDSNVCDLLDTLNKIDVVSTSKIKTTTGTFIGVLVNIYYETIFSYIDYEDFLYDLGRAIKKKYGLRLVFEVNDEINQKERNW